MNYPSLQVNNFFENPDYIRDYAESLTYVKPEGDYPGLRATSTEQNGHFLFQDINFKIIRLLYPDYTAYSSVLWNTSSSFQKIKYEDVEAHMLNKKYPGKGWIHNDHESKFTAIVYLSNHENCGTALYSQKSSFNTTRCNAQLKNDYYAKKPNVDMNEYYKQFNDHYSKFKLDCVFNSAYNKLIGFDGSTPHGALFNLKPGEERLMYISFFYDINAPYYPIPEMRRT